MIVIDLSKQQALDVDPRAIQQINFTGNLDQAERAFMFFIYEEAKKNYFGTFIWNCKSIVNMLYNNLIWFIITSIQKMTQQNNLKVKLSNSKLNKLKSAMQNETVLNLRI